MTIPLHRRGRKLYSKGNQVWVSRSIYPERLQHFITAMKNLAFFVSLLILGACNSDSNPSEVESKLTAGVWLEKEHWLDEDNDGMLTLTEYDNDCNTDDEYHFESGGNFKFNDGANLCEPGFPVAISGNWQLSNNDTYLQLVFDFDNDTLYFEILGIRDSQLTLNRFFPDDPVAAPYERVVLRR